MYNLESLLRKYTNNFILLDNIANNRKNDYLNLNNFQFINYVLFDPKYLIDQFLYVIQMNEFRSNGLGLVELQSYEGLKRSRVQMSTILLSFFPVISYLTVTSLAFVNKLISFAM